MKKVILSSSLDDRIADIKRRQDEFESEFNSKKETYDKKYNEYRSARDAAADEITQEIRRYSKLDSFSTLKDDVRIIAEPDWDDGFNIIIRDEDHTNDKNKALSWHFSVKLDDEGNVKKDSGSWSGLNVTTPETIQNLREIAEYLNVISNLDWSVILRRPIPKYMDYMKNVDNPAYTMKRPNFEQEKLKVEIDSLVGSSKAILGDNYDGSFYTGSKVYYLIKSGSSSQYTVAFLPESIDSNPRWKDQAIEDTKYTKRISIDKLIKLIDKPIKTIDIKELS